MEKPSEQFAKDLEEDDFYGLASDVHALNKRITFAVSLLDQLWEEVERLKRERAEVREASDSLDLKV